MKAKHLLLAAVVLLALGGFWFHQRSRLESHSTDSATADAASGAASRAGAPKSPTGNRHPLLPPNPNRAFDELTPEQRVQRARSPHGVGG